MTSRAGRKTIGIFALAMAGLVAACGDRDYSAEDPATGPRSGPQRQYDPNRDASVFGEGGVSLGNLRSGAVGGLLGGDDGKSRLPVNKYLWQGALDTVSFLPLSSTDPFTGVIATDWGSTPQAPAERFKVTVYILSPALSAASLRVAVYREMQAEGGAWVPAEVSAETAVKLEDAILTRARQIRIAELGDGTSG